MFYFDLAIVGGLILLVNIGPDAYNVIFHFSTPSNLLNALGGLQDVRKRIPAR